MAYDFYFAGSQCREADELIVELGANRLLSYLNDKKQVQRYFQHKMDGWKGKLIIDSGAFTAHRKDVDIDIDTYIEWLNTHKDYIDYAIVLDHIPGKFGVPRTIQDTKYGATKSFENFEYMTQNLEKPTMLLPVFHQGEDFRYLDKYLNFEIEGTKLEYMCVSAMKDLTRQQRQDWYDQVYRYIEKSNNPYIKTHILGSNTDSDVEQFPVTSMDATTWIMMSANGYILTPDGMIYVGVDNGKPEHIDNMNKTVIKQVNDYLLSIGLSVEKVKENYKNRTLANVRYIYENSKKISYKKPTVKKRRLL